MALSVMWILNVDRMETRKSFNREEDATEVLYTHWHCATGYKVEKEPYSASKVAFPLSTALHVLWWK